MEKRNKLNKRLQQDEFPSDYLTDELWKIKLFK